jgi:hypothetical protein
MDKGNRENYYEKTDFSALIKAKKGVRVGKTVKRITLNISDQIYSEANQLDLYMRMGYQNVLKSAMTIGLTELYNHLSHHAIQKRKEPRLSTLPVRKRKPALKKQMA